MFRKWNQFAHLKVKSLSPCSFLTESFNFFYYTYFGWYNNIPFSQCSTLVSLPLFHIVAFLRWANCSLGKDAFPFIRPLGIRSWSPGSYTLLSQRFYVALQPEKLYCIIKINKTWVFIKKSLRWIENFLKIY